MSTVITELQPKPLVTARQRLKAALSELDSSPNYWQTDAAIGYTSEALLALSDLRDSLWPREVAG